MGGKWTIDESRRRNWCFTSFKMDLEPGFNDKFMKYLVYGREICPDTKREHWQGYVELKNGMTFSALKVAYGDNSVHLEPRISTAEKAANYCKKDGKFKEFGKISKQGERNDLKAVDDAIACGDNYVDISEKYGIQFMKYHKGIREKLNCKYASERAQRDVEVVVLVGPTGCGKTSYVYEEYSESLFDMVCTKGNSQWFDGYEDQKVLLLDEFTKECIDYAFLLRLLDRYPMRLPVKGSHAYAAWNTVFITSNLLIPEWYSSTDISPLLRRITQYHDFYNGKSYFTGPDGFQEMDLCVAQKSPGNTIPATVFGFKENLKPKKPDEGASHDTDRRRFASAMQCSNR